MSSSTSSAGRWRSSTTPTVPAPPADRPTARWPRSHPILGGAVLLLVLVGPTRAHDIPDERVDRGIQVLLGPSRLRVDYEVSLSEWTLYQDLKRLAPERAPGERIDRIEGYAGLVAPLNARGLLVTVDGLEISWEVGPVSVEYEQHPLLRFRFEAEIPAEGTLLLRDTNYVSSYGTSRLAMAVGPDVEAVGFDGPASLSDVPELPAFLLTDQEEAGTRELDVAYRPAIGTRVAPIPSPDESLPPASDDRDASAPERGQEGTGGLTRLLWDAPGRAAPLLLLAAFVIGVAHAVQPGHGKTAVVGASIQGPRPVVRGLLLAGTAATMHFLLAIGLAIVLVVLAPVGFEQIDEVATRGVGLVLGIIGAWRVGASLNGVSRRGGHAGRPVESRRDAVLAGLAIGAIPCWDAVLLLAMAWVTGRALLGVAMLVAFSLGASVTLLGVAFAAGLFRTLAHRLTASPLLERSLGAVGGLLLGGIGAFLFLR